jgi:lipopolysaccharide transport system permease protein
VFWALIRPFLAMLIFTIISGQLARPPSDGTAPLPLDGPRRQTGMLEIRG